MHVPARYQRRGAVQLFAGLLVPTGETLTRCFERKRFVEFPSFRQLLFCRVWCRRIRSLHLILDNGSTHAPRRLAAWLTSLDLPFPVHVHWLPVNAAWLDQIEIVFSELPRKARAPNDFESTYAGVRRTSVCTTGRGARRKASARPRPGDATTIKSVE